MSKLSGALSTIAGIIFGGMIIVVINSLSWAPHPEMIHKSNDLTGPVMHRPTLSVKHLSSQQEALNLIQGKIDKRAMILIYSPGCPACAKIKPEYARAADRMALKSITFYAYSTAKGLSQELVDAVSNKVPAIFAVGHGKVREVTGHRTHTAFITEAESLM